MEVIFKSKVARMMNAYRRRNRDRYARAECKALCRVIRLLRD